MHASFFGSDKKFVFGQKLQLWVFKTPKNDRNFKKNRKKWKSDGQWIGLWFWKQIYLSLEAKSTKDL